LRARLCVRDGASLLSTWGAAVAGVVSPSGAKWSVQRARNWVELSSDVRPDDSFTLAPAAVGATDVRKLL
jgi:hypothetical protein